MVISSFLRFFSPAFLLLLPTKEQEEKRDSRARRQFYAFENCFLFYHVDPENLKSLFHYRYCCLHQSSW
ncbi:unnamed protein product [Amoebophrya sp. A120]|nr:unnamed protein product [Amoebophrya sp. A120]|eukprot:GSA120T00002282001.1